MEKMTVLEEISRNDDILSLPQAITELLREIDQPNFSTDSIARVILKDPALTSRILKLANSSFYQRFARTTTVQQAVQVLGISTVKCMALSSSVLNAERIQRLSHINAKHFFADILSVAVGAEKIAKAVGYKASDEAFIAGLLHDVGIIFFLHHHASQYAKIADRHVKAGSVTEAERALFGIDHCEVGYHLAVKWRLPNAVCEAIRDHHLYDRIKPGVSIPNILKLATLFGANTFENYGWDPFERMSRTEELAGALGLSSEAVEEISSTLLSEALQAASFLDTDIGSVEELLTRANKEIWRTYLIVHNLFQERQELSQKLLKEERAKGAVESKNIAIATLSHYVNNAAMAMYGRTQLLRQRIKRGEIQRAVEILPTSLDVIENAIKKTVAVIAEIKDISPIDEVEFYNMSQAMNIDDRIAQRMKELAHDSGLVLPDEEIFESPRLKRS